MPDRPVAAVEGSEWTAEEVLLALFLTAVVDEVGRAVASPFFRHDTDVVRTRKDDDVARHPLPYPTDIGGQILAVLRKEDVEILHSSKIDIGIRLARTCG